MKPIQAIIAALTFSLTASAGATAHAAGDSHMVVIATSGSAPVLPGAMIAPGQEIDVAAGTSIVLLARSGQLLQMKGPCLCKVPGADPAPAPQAEANKAPKPKALTRGFTIKPDLWTVALPNLQALSRAPGADLPGKTRGGVKPVPAQPSLWYMAVDSSGDRCVRRGTVTLWRRKAGVAVLVNLRSNAVRQTGLTWPAGQQTLDLPDHIVVDGTLLMVSIDSQPRRLNVHVLPETIDESEWGEILIWMAARNCRRQAQFLVDGLNDGSLFPDHNSRPGLSEL